MKYSKEYGFTTVDISVAMLVIIIFVSITSSVMYNVYLSSTEARRTATALNYAVDIFENIGIMDYSAVTESGIMQNLKPLKVSNIQAVSERNKGNYWRFIWYYNKSRKL